MSVLNGKEYLNFLVVGVGGQGVLLTSNVLSEAGLMLGLDVKKSEVHGMSQRGGSVNSHVRWGPEVFSPLIGKGEVDVLLSLERLETLRYLDLLHPESIVIADPHPIYPITVSAGKRVYPEEEDVRSWVAQVVRQVYWVPGTQLAQDLGNAKAANMVLVGALSALLDVPEDVWRQAMKRRVPSRFLDLNYRAFEAGREVVSND
ncbi:MAG: indolepyruvate oxidoreductase subunit beta [Chloroflexi bacterium]|nr:indolepyruvate oxidoreductase subunit beta [Chloroflexota bacterium]